jgi:hypothetical protein
LFAVTLQSLNEPSSIFTISSASVSLIFSHFNRDFMQFASAESPLGVEVA